MRFTNTCNVLISPLLGKNTIHCFGFVELSHIIHSFIRIIQYASKFISWLLEQEGLSDELIARVKTLESSVSTARKCGLG